MKKILFSEKKKSFDLFFTAQFLRKIFQKSKQIRRNSD